MILKKYLRYLTSFAINVIINTLRSTFSNIYCKEVSVSDNPEFPVFPEAPVFPEFPVSPDYGLFPSKWRGKIFVGFFNQKGRESRV